MNIPNPPPAYSPKDQRDLRTAIAEADVQNMKRGEPIVSLNVVNADTGETQTIQWTNAGWSVV